MEMSQNDDSKPLENHFHGFEPLSIRRNRRETHNSMKYAHHIMKNIIYTLGILGMTFCICLGVETVFNTYSCTPALFTLAVFLVSLVTEGVWYGLIASLISMLAINFAFTFPYFKFNFSIPENIVSAFILLVITIMSGMLTTKLKQTQRIKAETEREKMRANLLRAVSHDLRTPLTAIYGSSATIVEQYDYLNKEQIIRLARGVQEDAEWLRGMVENLLSVTKITNSNVQLIKTSTVLEELIEVALIRFRKRYPDQQVVIDIPDEFISIPMDARLIEQVIVNMLENAVQHAEGMTELILKVFTLGQDVIFEIMDDGCGIPKEQLPHIFTGYFEKKNTPVDNRKSGMGIGLSVCASIVQAHDGEVSAENRKTGGSCFRFSLKREEADYEL